MDPNTFPTKGNLILAKNSLALARQGFDLMDKKRNILIRELMDLIDQAKDIQSQIDSTFRKAYAELQTANMEMGINYVQTISYSIPVDETVTYTHVYEVPADATEFSISFQEYFEDETMGDVFFVYFTL